MLVTFEVVRSYARLAAHFFWVNRDPFVDMRHFSSLAGRQVLLVRSANKGHGDFHDLFGLAQASIWLDDQVVPHVGFTLVVGTVIRPGDASIHDVLGIKFISLF